MQSLETRLERAKDINIAMDRRNTRLGGTKGEKTVQRTHNGQNHDRKTGHGGRVMWMVVAAAALVSLSNIATVAAADMQYCSDVNTGADGATKTDIYQSNGLCSDYCRPKGNAFAIVQGTSCWCSDYAPASDTSGCDSPCPGYPSDTCGNSGKQLYGYIALGNEVKGTQGSVDETTTSQPTKTTSSKSTPPPSSTSTTSTKEEEEEETTTTKPTTTDKPQVSIITSVGGIQTVTYIPTNIPSATSDSQTGKDVSSEETKGGGISSGAIAGIVVGVLLGLILLGLGIFFMLRRRNAKPYDSEPGSIGAGGAGVISGGRRRSRSLSTLGLIGEKSGSPSGTPPGGTQNSAIIGAAVTPENSAASNGVHKPGEPFDQRLDPNQLFMRFDHRTGSSRMSVRSLRDDTDYSRRVLRLANPDD